MATFSGGIPKMATLPQGTYYQQCLVNNGGEKNFLKAFKNNNLVGLIIFSSLFLELNIS